MLSNLLSKGVFKGSFLPLAEGRDLSPHKTSEALAPCKKLAFSIKEVGLGRFMVFE